MSESSRTDEQKMRMDAYYYGFAETGVPAIDKVLSAVACAGKAFHGTEQWTDETSPWPPHTGDTPVDWIWNAAKEAADEIERLRQEVQELTYQRDQAHAEAMSFHGGMGAR